VAPAAGKVVCINVSPAQSIETDHVMAILE
jgi:biotin carboxyl carrier protein